MPYNSPVNTITEPMTKVVRTTFSVSTKLKIIRLIKPVDSIHNIERADFSCWRITRIGGVFNNCHRLGNIKPINTIALVKIAIGNGPNNICSIENCISKLGIICSMSCNNE